MAGAQVLAALRRELFRTLLLQRIEFFDRHDPGELTALLSVELDTLRTFVFRSLTARPHVLMLTPCNNDHMHASTPKTPNLQVGPHADTHLC